MTTRARLYGNAEGVLITGAAVRAGLEAAKWRNRRPRKTVPKYQRTGHRLERHIEWSSSGSLYMSPTPKLEMELAAKAKRKAEADKWLERVKRRKKEKTNG